MLRGPHLDVPGVPDSVMVRGIDRCAIFRDGYARADFSRPRGSRPGVIRMAVWCGLAPGRARSAPAGSPLSDCRGRRCNKSMVSTTWLRLQEDN